jgi:hypothetical protein
MDVIINLYDVAIIICVTYFAVIGINFFGRMLWYLLSKLTDIVSS